MNVAHIVRHLVRTIAVLATILLLGACNGKVDGIDASTPRPIAESPTSTPSLTIREFDVPNRARPHDVAPAPDGGVWYTAQGSGELGYLNPNTGETRHVSLGSGSSPHGVIVGPDGAPWITDSGLNAIVRVDPRTDELSIFKLPSPNVNLNTGTFDGDGKFWFTGQSGTFGSLDLTTGKVQTYSAPRGRGPYGIATAPDGTPWYSSLAGSYLAKINRQTGQVETFDTPTRDGGARRVWSDSNGLLWVTEWFAGKLARFDPNVDEWREWTLPGESPEPYAVFVDDQDIVWISDFGSNSLVRFDPKTENFEQLMLPSPNGSVRQILGRPGEVWGAESGASKLVFLRTR